MTPKNVVLAVVIGLAVIAGVGLVGLIVLAKDDTAAASLAVVAGPTGTAIGALASVLARTSTDNSTVPDPIDTTPTAPPV